MNNQSQIAPGDLAIYHLTPAGYYHRQAKNQAYKPERFTQDGFIHCTSGADMLVEIANAYFVDLPGNLLALEIDPTRLTAPLKFEAPIPPPLAGEENLTPDPGVLFPHIYGPLNRQAIIDCFALQRDKAGQWRIPK